MLTGCRVKLVKGVTDVSVTGIKTSWITNNDNLKKWSKVTKGFKHKKQRTFVYALHNCGLLLFEEEIFKEKCISWRTKWMLHVSLHLIAIYGVIQSLRITVQGIKKKKKL